jgi:hypothetical protein
MNFSFNSPTYLVIEIGSFAIISILTTSIFYNYYQILKWKVERLRKREKEIKKNVSELYSQQLQTLHKMYSVKSITLNDYNTKKEYIINEMTAIRLDTKNISEDYEIKSDTTENLNISRMKKASLLHELGQMSDPELDKHINESLDNLK